MILPAASPEGPPAVPLPASFFLRHPSLAAPDLIGKVLTRRTDRGLLALRITETEAYGGEDPASHSFSGPSPRNRSMFLSGGRIYVYLIYGIHFCLNLVTQEEGTGSAVLLRAGEPVDGRELMWENRYGSSCPAGAFSSAAPSRKIRELTSGPGRLCSALGIRREGFDGQVLDPEGICVWDDGFPVSPEDLGQSPRIGITRGAGTPWRWFLKGSPFVTPVPSGSF